ncbi:carbohydrate kinase family protein [Candidatus Izemoplasma sp. B36]|uniref:carbohydrate kinase family protein n=1 Tax=Candidatus Izemoplasma sp. B36 TaxID=3242468 RepID=UPI003557DA22
MKILVLGGASYDDIVHVDEFFEATSSTVFTNKSYATPGSTGIGKSIALKKLGFDVTFQALIGDDYYGKMITNTMKKEGVKFHPHITDKTEKHINIMNKHGERITMFTQMPNELDIDVYKYEKLIKEADIVALNIKNYCRYYIPLLKKYNKPVFCDLHDYDGFNPHHQDFIINSDHIFFSTEKMKNYELFMNNMINKGKKLVIATKANDGAVALDKNGLVEIPSNKIKIIDTNGAGDNFFAGFLYGYTHKHNLKDSLLMGRIAAESCIQSEKIVSDELSEAYLEENFEKLKNIVENLYDIG